MNIPLSPRLAQCCKLIPKRSIVADIGCDHGYLSIYLLKNGIAKQVIAADIGEQPLKSAMANARRFGIEDNIRFYLSDGAMNIPRDFTHMVCAGMGADTMIHILENAPWLRNEQYTLILQCQSKTPTLRKYLSDNGFCITQETVLKDGRFLYTIMEVRYQQCTPLTAGECWLSPALAVSGSPYLPAYYKQVMTRLQRAINGQKENADPNMVAALTELENNPAFKELSYDNS
jgi:tRNA (adenine22-N1)-methyltransferase